MAFVGTIIQEVVKIKKNRLEKKVVYSEKLQVDTLRKLLNKAKNTAFGKQYNFKQVLNSGNTIHQYQENVPVFDYNQMHDNWWHKSLNDEENISWPGKIKFYALTSGTSGSPSKRIPVTTEMLQSMRQTSIRQMLCMYDFKMPNDFYTKQLLMVGGSAKLSKIGQHFEGDLSGILATQVPRWFYRFRKPAKKIASLKDWDAKLDAITKNAHKWDIGIVGGVPAWVQLLFERMLAHYQVETIHDIWPNMCIYVHGGVAFAPYEKSIKKYMGKEMIYLDTYLASEGFMAFENATSKPSMQLVLDKGIFFEFVPFNDDNFENGEIKDNPEVLNIYEVEKGVNYAMLISTCAGLWRYMIGDTVKFTNLEEFEVVITGRTKHFLSLCGEHLSVDNMNMALKHTGNELGFNANEFTVAGVPYQGSFAHKWFIGTDTKINEEQVKITLDKHLCALNDDYGTERKHALKDVIIQQVPTDKFYKWMESNGKIGGQAKFPRVLKTNQLQDWENFIGK